MADWWWKAELFETCNCAPFACPCNYTSIPTDGTCKSVVAYHIKEGAFCVRRARHSSRRRC
jgi:hypothetical protein